MSAEPERQYRLPRIWSNEQLRLLAPRFSGRVLNVSGWKDQDKQGGYYRDYFENASEYHVSNHPTEDRGFQEGDLTIDLDCGPAKDLHQQYDVVLNHTVLEHLFNVHQAFSYICCLSRDVVISVVPFAQAQHAIGKSYGDYWRLTSDGMRRLHVDNGFEVVYEAESPHKHAGVYLLFVGARNPEQWRDRLPAFERIVQAGAWIGAKSIK